MIKKLLPKNLQDVLTEDTITAIETAITEKINISVEAALSDQDDVYATKLESLIEALDQDRAAKLQRAVATVDRNNAAKLNKLVKLYEKANKEDAEQFKNTLVESISDYIEEYIDEVIPTQAINEATQNKTATAVLANLRKVLAVDSTLMSESVKTAVIDGKRQIDDITARLAEVEKENKLLKEAYNKTKSNLLLEQRTAKFATKKKDYVTRVLSDKSPKFIEENFDYTCRLFDKKEAERLQELHQEAFDSRQVKADAQHIVSESKENSDKVNVNSNPYLAELQRMK